MGKKIRQQENTESVIEAQPAVDIVMLLNEIQSHAIAQCQFAPPSPISIKLNELYI